MGYRECTDYLGGSTGEPCGPYNYGVGSGPLQPFNQAQFAPLIDRMLGNAFMLVKLVADHLAIIKYIAFNMQTLVYLAESAVKYDALATTLATMDATALSSLSSITATQAAALLNAAVPGFPVYSGVGAAPVATNSIYIDVNGNLKVAG